MSKPKDGPTGALMLKELLQQKNEEFNLKDDIFGMTLLTNPGYTSSTRSTMFTSHLRQTVGLDYPDYPGVSTNYENIVGKNSTGYYKAKTHLEVVDKVQKFTNGKDDDHIYFLFVYDKKNDRYDIIEKKVVEDLTEKFGFIYNNEGMDSKSVGDTINKDEVLYKTNSYDEFMNYCYGKNVKFVYMLENNTIEDAIIVSESLRQEMSSKEVETVKVSLNDNDILCNIYGNSDIYKSFPDIGEFIDDRVVCAKRRVHNNQVIYDLKKSNLRKINYSSDTLSFCEGRVVDINIYCNKSLKEIERNSFNEQMIEYLEMQERFYRNIYLRCKKIIESGSEYSNDINYFYKKAKNYLDDDYKWREDDSVFSNMIIEFVIERSVPLSVGQKLTGRFGNKGVISKILPDDEMPFLETGEQVKVIFNSLTVINRLNSQQLYEQSINFICNRVLERMRSETDIDTKVELLLKTVRFFNERQADELEKYLKKMKGKSIAKYLERVEADRIYIHNPPMWEDEAIFDRLIRLYDEFSWIKPYDVFVNRFGRPIKIMKPLIVGDMYILKLKQTSKKGFSVRSTGGLSKRGLPEKTNKTKIHQELYSKTPIRIGDQENINSAIGVDMEELANLHMMYRSSVIGRRALGEKLITGIKELDDFPSSPNFTNRNVEILNAYFLFMGISLRFSTDMLTIGVTVDTIRDFEDDGKIYICSEDEFNEIKLENDVRRKLSEDNIFIGTTEEFDDRVKEEIRQIKLKENSIEVDQIVID